MEAKKPCVVIESNNETAKQVRRYGFTTKLKDSLPICHIVLKALKPERKPYPKELKTYGDHLRKKRLDLNLSQPQVAKIINVTPDSITNWELNRNEPSLNQIPKIISFLGYTPTFNMNLIKKYSLENIMSQKKLAEVLKIDPTTLSRIERNDNKISNRIKGKMNCITLLNIKNP